jgi:hypothetical protein
MDQVTIFTQMTSTTSAVPSDTTRMIKVLLMSDINTSKKRSLHSIDKTSPKQKSGSLKIERQMTDSTEFHHGGGRGRVGYGMIFKLS